MIDVIIHCSASPFGNAAMIDGWHADRGFDNGRGHHIGYHYVILNGMLASKKYNSMFDGHLETGRALDDDADFEPDERAAATIGKNMGVQICLVGESNKFTPAQLEKLPELIMTLKVQFGNIRISQHSDHTPDKPYCAGLSQDIINHLNVLAL